jgi:hypothetical protein
MVKFKKYLKQTLPLMAALGFVVLSPLSAAAATTTTTTTNNQDISQAVTQSYNADSSVQMGMIVNLKANDSTTVEPLSQGSINTMLGVTVAANDAALTLSPQNVKQQQVYVATYGRYATLVSTQNGPIRAGDYITISSLAGVGMKAGSDQSVVLGKATTNFSGTSNVEGSVTVKDNKGNSAKVAIGRIPVSLEVAHNPLASKATDYVPSFLAKTAVTVAGKPVSAARIYLGTLTLLVSALVTGNILYSGVKSGMTAIGRNPLSRKSIIRSLIQTVIAGLIIFVVGVFAVYLLLKL